MRGPTVGVLWLAFAIASAACTGSPESMSVEVTKAWLRAAPAAGGTSAIYMRIRNTQGDPDRLLGAESSAARSIETHATDWDGDVASMHAVGAIDIPAGGTVAIEPGGFHLMLVDLTGPLRARDRIPVVFRFEAAGEVRVEAEVRQP